MPDDAGLGEPLVIQLQRGIRLFGRVIDAAGRPISQAAVMLSTHRGPYDGPRTMTDQDGRYEMQVHSGGINISVDTRPRSSLGKVLSDTPRVDVPTQPTTVPEDVQQWEVNLQTSTSIARGDTKPDEPATSPDFDVQTVDAKQNYIDDAMWRTKVPFTQLTVPIAGWSEPVNGLRLGLHIPDKLAWRTGDSIPIQLWAHNATDKDIPLVANPNRADGGLVVVARDAQGNDHYADAANVSLLIVPNQCVLPARFAGMVKSFSLSFVAADDAEQAWLTPRFRGLEKGTYQLRCIWSDPHPLVSAAGNWTGELVSTEFECHLNIPQRIQRNEQLASHPGVDVRNGFHLLQQSGRYDIGRGRAVRIVRPANAVDSENDVRQTAGWYEIEWPATESWPASRLRVVPDTGGKAGSAWAVAWLPGSDQLWFVDSHDVGSLDITNPSEVLMMRAGRGNSSLGELSPSDELLTVFRDLGFDIGREQTAGSEFQIGGNTGGERMLCAETIQTWTVRGVVKDTDGRPMANVPVRVRTEYHPTINVVTTRTDDSGHYQVSFPLDLRTLAHWRGIMVEPVLAGFTERQLSVSGEFNALLTADEQPQRRAVELYPPMWVAGSGWEVFRPGPIERFSDSDLVIGMSATADFEMQQALDVTGRIVLSNGQAALPHFISIASPQQRQGYSVGWTTSEQDSSFRLNQIPSDMPLVITVNPAGRPAETRRSSVLTLTANGSPDLRLILPASNSGTSELQIEIVR